MHNLAVAYSQGSGVKRDYLLACHWHKKAAKLGDRESQYNLAYYYTVGKGVRRHDRKAAYWLLQAAQQGCPDAALELAARYWRAKGVKRDIAKMTQWLRKAARHSEKPRRILEAISSGANVTVVDDLFPSAQSARRGLDKEMIRAHAELQSEIRAQLERARTRAAAVQRKSAREDLVPGARLGRRLEQALGEASAAALRSVTQRTDP
jgi:TPR repeat protein